jgi:drug/metabolite transporter (DMT)-like permease
MDVKKAGILCVLGASVMWALEPILAKLSYTDSDFLHTSAIRAIFIALTAFTYVLITKKGDVRIKKKEVPVLIYIALVAVIFSDLLFFYALTKVSVINAVLVGHMQPIFIILLGYFLLKDRLNKYDYFGILSMIIAGLLVTTRTWENLISFKIGTIGDLFVLLATIGWATTTIAMRRYLKKMNSGVITFYRAGIASIVFIIYLLMTSYFSISNIYQILVGVVVGIGTILYYEALKRLKAAQVGAIELSTPFFAAILSYFMIHELITLMQFLGILILIFGVYLLSRKEK